MDIQKQDPNEKKLSNCQACGSIIAKTAIWCPRCGYIHWTYKLPIDLIFVGWWVTVVGGIIIWLLMGLLLYS